MHQCKNNSNANVYHLEQMVDNFFPYSQQQLGFQRPVTIVFQSDKDNSMKVLGKTAYYDPSADEVYLYVDGRHPKDVLRSLSHELVHHAQNCRGDFGDKDETTPGYAQKNPHLRKMEREAYTKGNLIFRDFEDLIKTGKIVIDVDFKKSGEPKMSLKEWKHNELNTLMMKKWGLLKEEKGRGKGDPTHDPEEDWQETGRRPPDALEEECPLADEEEEALAEVEEVDEGASGGAGGGSSYRDEDDPTGRPTHRHANPLKALSGKDYEGIQDPEVVNIKGDQPGMAKKLADKGAPEFTGGRVRKLRSAAAKERLRGPRPVVQEKRMVSLSEIKRLTREALEKYIKENK